MEGRGLLSLGRWGPAQHRHGGSTAEGSPSHGHLENILRAVRSGWCCTLRPLPSQALSQPQIIMDFSSWSQRQGQTFCLEAGLRLEPEVHLDRFPWEVGSQRKQPPARCRELLCFAVCFVERAGLVSSCSFFFLAALFCMQPETLPACWQLHRKLQGCL